MKNQLINRIKAYAKNAISSCSLDTERYIEEYAKQTDMRVEENPQQAIGGMWEEIGQLQFEYLVRNGLKPAHTLLDIGCGTLRGGRHFIRYMNESNYYGIDISEKALKYARKLIDSEALLKKHPTLLLNSKKNLKFEEFQKIEFDYILAQSVFTHLPKDMIIECINNIANIMHKDTMFFFTFHKSDYCHRSKFKEFHYPFSFIQKLAKENGFVAVDDSAAYRHPKKQRQCMVKLVKKQ